MYLSISFICEVTTLSIDALAKNESLGFAKGWLVCRVKPKMQIDYSPKNQKFPINLIPNALAHFQKSGIINFKKARKTWNIPEQPKIPSNILPYHTYPPLNMGSLSLLLPSPILKTLSAQSKLINPQPNPTSNYPNTTSPT